VIALIVAIVLPLGYFILGYRSLVAYLDLVAEVKADAITTGVVTPNPRLWPYQVQRLEGLLSREPIALEHEAANERDATGNVLARIGRSPDPPALRRSHELHESGGVVGRVEVEHSLRGLLYGTAIAALLGVLLGAGVFATLRILPLRALRRVTGALEQKIKEREIVQTELQESEDRYRKLFELSPDGMLIVSEGKIVLVNGMCLRMLGASAPEELIGKPLLDIFHSDYRERVRERMHQMQEKNLPLPAVERKILMLDGAAIDVEVAASPFTHRGRQGTQVVMRDITDRKEANDRLNYLAQYDSLTDLPNRGLFQDRLEHGLAQAKRNGCSAAVLFIDLDRFKIVNDTLGHGIGDKLLLQVAARLSGCTRTGDTVGRFGGDEFGVILLDLVKPEAAAVVAQKINDALARPFDLDGHRTFISASIGITLYPADATDPATLNMNADAAMYRAKEAGRNTYRFFTREMNERAMQRMQMEASMRRALERGEFLLHYQPKVDLASGAICGMEALLRWAHPKKGLVSPAEFVPVLEETGLIVPAGEWVTREACRQIAAWQQAGLEAPHVAVNLSARQFRQKNLEEMVRAILAETGVAPALLQFEITESLLMNDPDGAVRTLLALRNAGVLLSVDDFGTGYSSLAYLKHFPLDALKIDRAFISDIVTNPGDASITLAVISLAHSLKLKVVAEGVETEAQLDLLTRYACDQMQGYYFSRPVAAAEMGAMLREGRRLARSQDRDHAGPAVVAA
jgi:diguanylate cyclase (GGDEF)-like protein/PAS domain S-box-containing protein